MTTPLEPHLYKLKRIRVYSSVLLRFITGRPGVMAQRRDELPFPPDMHSSVITKNDDPYWVSTGQHGTVWLLVESEEFEPIKEGDEIPELEVDFYLLL